MLCLPRLLEILDDTITTQIAMHNNSSVSYNLLGVSKDISLHYNREGTTILRKWWFI